MNNRELKNEFYQIDDLRKTEIKIKLTYEKLERNRHYLFNHSCHSFFELFPKKEQTGDQS
jgi:hypothetical protein